MPSMSGNAPRKHGGRCTVQAEPRWDEGAEQSVIGAVMLDPRNLDEAPVSAEDFYRPQHEELWRLITGEVRKGGLATPFAVSQRLLSRPITGLDAAYLHTCVELAPPRGAVRHYADAVTGFARLRKMVGVGERLIQEAQTAHWDEAEPALDRGRVILDRLSDEAGSVNVRTFAQALESVIESWEKPNVKGHPTGWSELDRKLNGGWKPGQLTVLGARPAVGKSLIAGCASVAVARDGVAFFSLEMSEAEVVARIAAAAQGIDLENMNSGTPTEAEWQKLSRLASRSQDWNLYLECESRRSMAQIRATVRTVKRKTPLPLVIIDYAQLVTPADRTEQRERQVSRIVEDCKHLSKEFDTHVLALAQVNRGSTVREDRRPTMSDLRESGGIEAHADNVILLHRDAATDHEIELIVAKNRHGETGTIKLAWRPQYASANSMATHVNDYRYGMESL